MPSYTLYLIVGVISMFAGQVVEDPVGDVHMRLHPLVQTTAGSVMCMIISMYVQFNERSP